MLRPDGEGAMRMFDTVLRRRLVRPLDAVAARLDRPWISPDGLTLLGLVLGLASAVLAAQQAWTWSLAAWLVSRLLDGLDGPLARRRRAGRASGVDGAGGFLDITCDFVVYGATVVGVAIGTATATWSEAGPGTETGAGAGTWLPFLAVLLAYYVNGTAFLAFSSIAERSGRRLDDGRSLSFLGGIAEGAETIVVHSLWLLLPAYAPQIATGWAVVVGVSAAHRIVTGYRALRSPA